MACNGEQKGAAKAVHSEREGEEDHRMGEGDGQGGEGEEEEEEKTSNKGDQAAGLGHQTANVETSSKGKTAEEKGGNGRNDEQMEEDDLGKDPDEMSGEERRFNLALEKETKGIAETFEMEEGTSGIFLVTGVKGQCFTSGAMTSFLKKAGLTLKVLKGTSGINPIDGAMTFKIVLKTDGMQ